MGRGGRGDGGGGGTAPPSGPVVDEQGFYRSDDSGNTFSRIGKVMPAAGRGGRGNTEPGTVEDENEQQPPAAAAPGGEWYRGGGAAYYFEIFVDPHRPDWIWSINTNMNISKDGGKTWETPDF
jgi:hypothetical protein